jgi:hypothetical protein
LLRLVLRQTGLHGKVRARQVQSAFQIVEFEHKLALGADSPFRSLVAKFFARFSSARLQAGIQARARLRASATQPGSLVPFSRLRPSVEGKASYKKISVTRGKDSPSCTAVPVPASLETIFLVVTSQCYNGFGSVSARPAALGIHSRCWGIVKRETLFSSMRQKYN